MSVMTEKRLCLHTGWRMDPYIPGRIWFDTQGKGTHTGKFGGPFAYVKPTQKGVVLPPQVELFTRQPQLFTRQPQLLTQLQIKGPEIFLKRWQNRFFFAQTI